LADKFDTRSALAIKYFNVRSFAQQFYQQANDGAIPKWLTIDEMSLSGNQLMSELRKKESKWKGDDDSKMLNQPINSNPKDHGDEIALQPQRIRTFVISYNQRKEFLDIAQKLKNIR
jgi:hypothetical protein